MISRKKPLLKGGTKMSQRGALGPKELHLLVGAHLLLLVPLVLLSFWLPRLGDILATTLMIGGIKNTLSVLLLGFLHTSNGPNISD